MSYGLNVEMHKQTEIVKRMSAIIGQVLPFLSQEHQQQVATAVDRAKQVTMADLSSAIGPGAGAASAAAAAGAAAGVSRRYESIFVLRLNTSEAGHCEADAAARPGPGRPAGSQPGLASEWAPGYAGSAPGRGARPPAWPPGSAPRPQHPDIAVLVPPPGPPHLHCCLSGRPGRGRSQPPSPGSLHAQAPAAGGSQEGGRDQKESVREQW